MDDRHFDALSKTLAKRGSRRAALKAGGTGAALLGLFGLRSAHSALAQSDATGLDENGICHLQFEANVRVGPGIENGQQSSISGILAFGVGENGGIDEGTLTLDDGREYPVIGQASGRSLSLRITIGDDTLVAVGVGDSNVRACAGEYGGPTTGPQRGDLGDWIAVAGASNASSSTTSSSSSGSSGSVSSTSQPGGSSSPTATATATAPADCDVECTGPFVVEATTCNCICPGGLLACGPVCCPINSVCTDESAGECSCPAGSSLCGDTCVACPAGQLVDNSSCQCVDAPCPSGQALCAGVCVDIVNDRNNCGYCGSICSPGISCIAGNCTCPPGYATCTDGCKDLAADAANCGTCGTVCSNNTSCVAGNCV